MDPKQHLAVVGAVHRLAQPTISSTTTTAAPPAPYPKAQAAETEVEVAFPTRLPTIRITPSGPLHRMAPTTPTRTHTDQPAGGQHAPHNYRGFSGGPDVGDGNSTIATINSADLVSLKRDREREGRCSECGAQTHELRVDPRTGARTKEALNVEGEVRRGRYVKFVAYLCTCACMYVMNTKESSAHAFAMRFECKHDASLLLEPLISNIFLPYLIVQPWLSSPKIISPPPPIHIDVSTATLYRRDAVRQTIPRLVLVGCHSRTGRYIVTISSPMPPSRILRSIRHPWRLIDLAAVVVVDSTFRLLALYRRIISSISLSSSITP